MYARYPARSSRTMVRPSIAAVLLVNIICLSLVRCTTIVPVPSPRHFLADSQPKYIWVTRGHDPEIRVERPSVRGDTLVGFVTGQPAKIPLSEITAATIHRKSTDTMVKVSVGIGAAIVAAVLVYKVTHQATFPSQP